MAIDIYCCTKIVTREWAGATVLCLFLVFALRSHAVFALAGRLAATILSGQEYPQSAPNPHTVSPTLCSCRPTIGSDRLLGREPHSWNQHLHRATSTTSTFTTLTDASGPAFFAFFGGFLRPTDKTSTTSSISERSSSNPSSSTPVPKPEERPSARAPNFARHPREQRDL